MINATLVTSWTVQALAKRRWQWTAQRGDRIASGEASSEGGAYMACDACLDEFLEAERKEQTG